jgi:hypothetical protein
MLVAVRPAGDRPAVFAAEIRSATWSGARTLDLALSGRPRWRTSREILDANTIAPRADGGGWIVSRAMSGLGGIELFEIDLDGSTRQVTSAPGDDDTPETSPDGSRVLFVTGRWDALNHYDLATYDRRTRTVTALTRTDAQERGPTWSHDGSTIAFFRTYFTRRRPELCFAATDGTDVRCRAVSQDSAAPIPVGWGADGRLLVLARQDTVQMLARLARLDGPLEPLGWVVTGVAQASPDGRWMLCQCRRMEDQRARWAVFPLDQPHDERRIVLAGDTTQVRLVWGPVEHAAAYVDRLEIATGAGDPMLGLPYRLTLHGFASDDTPTSVLRARWRSLDMSIATIDSDGVLVPRRVGRLTIEASAGAWRLARRELTIRPRTVTVAFREDWTAGIVPRWRVFGQPVPRTVADPRLGTALLLDGDGSFVSGVHTAQALPLRDGLAVEAVVSDSFRLMQWREVQVRAVSYADRMLATWDHADNAFPREPPLAACGMVYPAGEGAWGGDSASFFTGTTTRTIAADAGWSRGTPIVARIQVLPDGRCGVAIDGRMRWISPPVAWPDSTYVEIRGNSYMARALVGRITVWTGVPPGVDWSLPRR